MREIKKSTKLDNVLYDVRGPVVEEAERMEEAGARILKLNIGNPAPFDFRAPEEMVFDMSRQLAECEATRRRRACSRRARPSCSTRSSSTFRAWTSMTCTPATA